MQANGLCTACNRADLLSNTIAKGRAGPGPSTSCGCDPSGGYKCRGHRPAFPKDPMLTFRHTKGTAEHAFPIRRWCTSRLTFAAGSLAWVVTVPKLDHVACVVLVSADVLRNIETQVGLLCCNLESVVCCNIEAVPTRSSPLLSVPFLASSRLCVVLHTLLCISSRCSLLSSRSSLRCVWHVSVPTTEGGLRLLDRPRVQSGRLGRSAQAMSAAAIARCDALPLTAARRGT